MRASLAAVVLLLAGIPAFAHRLDEYLQGSIISIERNRLEGEMTLTPGVAVFPFLNSQIDTDASGAISEEEQQAYAARVLRDLSLMVDGRRVAMRLVSMRFPAVAEMQEGRGGIELNFEADLPRGGRSRKLVFENHHMSRIAAYQANCLIPRDPLIRIAAQKRNYSQSSYELDYEDLSASWESSVANTWPGGTVWMSAIGLLLLTRLGYQASRASSKRRARSSAAAGRGERCVTRC